MASAWAHEAAQPLAAAATDLSTARRLLGGYAEAAMALDQAISQTHRAGRAIEFLTECLAVRVPSEPCADSLHHLIRRAAEVATPALKDSGIALDLRLEAPKDVILANRIELQQALARLICVAARTAVAAGNGATTIATSLRSNVILMELLTGTAATTAPITGNSRAPNEAKSFR